MDVTPIEFTADKPFVYMIYEQSSGTILFSQPLFFATILIKVAIKSPYLQHSIEMLCTFFPTVITTLCAHKVSTIWTKMP